MARLCSENKTRRTVEAILDGEYHVLVITAGSLLELLKADRLYVEFFSVVVFDECHHCTGNHAYVQLLEELNVKTSCTETKPRILGLTASPFPAKCIPTAQKNLSELKSNIGAVIFKPALPHSHQHVIWRIIDWSPAQQQFINAVKAFIKDRARRVNIMAGNEMVCSTDIEMENFPKILGQLRLVSNDSGIVEGLRDLCGQLFTLLASLELCDVVGVPAAFDALTASSIAVPGAVRTSGDSPRLIQLVQEIKNAADDAKILVFVSTRETVRVLWDVLRGKFPKLNPLRVVGHGGYDGMEWEREQKEAIKSFSEGRSRLLVCTSVLEEGLDVSECDLVIRFYGSSSLIQFIQSRGRARKVGAQLVTILSQEHKHRVAELETQERIMDSVIQNAAVSDGLPSKRCNALLEAATMRDPSNVIVETLTTEDIHLPTDSRAFSLRIYVDGEITQTEEGSLQRLLADEFELYGRMKIYRIHCMSRNAARLHPSTRCFRQTDSAVLLGVTPQQQSQTEVRNCLEELSRNWNFKLRDRAVWVDMPFPTSSTPHDQSIDIESISAGYLLSKSEFDERKFSQCSTFHFHKEVITILINVSTRMRIAISSLNSCGILSVDGRTSLCSLFLPLTSAPILEYCSALDWVRVVRGDENESLCALCTYPSICLRVPIHLLRALCSHLANPSFAVPVFIGRVTRFHCTDSIEEHIRSNPPISAIVKWSLGIIASDWNLVISPQAIKFLKQAALAVPADIAAGILDQLHFLATNSGSMWDSLASMFKALKVPFSNISPAQRNRRSAATRDYVTIICSKLASQVKMEAMYFEALIRPFLVMPTQLQTLDFPLPFNYALLPCVIVTPLRIILAPHVVAQQSRFLRRFSDKRILVVRFREEQLQDLHEKCALRRVEHMLSNGLKVLGETFWFVIASQSQLRNSSAYFVACSTQSAAEDIRRDLLPNRPDVIAKVMRLLGLFCSSDQPVCSLGDPAFVNRIPDTRNLKGSLLTDGSGLCNAKLTSELKRVAQSPNSIAFQIRYGGAKGVVVHSPKLSDDRPMLLLRPSMIKCESDDVSLCLIKAAKFTRLRLNREIITLLESYRWIQGVVGFDVSETLNEIQEYELDQLVRMLSEPIEAQRRLSTVLDASVLAVATSTVDICTEPFWARLLRVIYKRAVRSLRSKTHLPVEKACMLMGVPDPEGILDKDEISIRYV